VLKAKDRIQNGRLCLRQTFCFPPGSADRLIGFCGKNRMVSAAQRGSGISILDGVNDEIITIKVENKMGFLAWGWDYEKQNAPAQRYSKMSILKIETENSLPQRYSKMSNGRLSGVLCWPHRQRAMSTVRIKNIVNAMGV